MPESLKMAATYSPTMQRSTIGDAGCVGGSAAPCSALSPMPSPRGSAAPLCARLRLYPRSVPCASPRASVRNGLNFSNPFQLNTTHTNPFQRLSTLIPRLPTLTTLIPNPKKRMGLSIFF